MKQKIQLAYFDSKTSEEYYNDKSEIFGINLIKDFCLLNKGKDNKFISLVKEKKTFLFSISERDYYYLLDKKISIEEFSNIWKKDIQGDTSYLYSIEYTLKLSIKEEL